MNSILIGGMGNVLLGDDGLGPYVLRLLESEYTFDEEVELADLGTPALDLTHRIAGRRGVILVDCIASEEHAPGTVLLYDKEALLSAIPARRLDPHSPALSECLLTAEMLGATPDRVWLVGVVGASFEPGKALSSTVRGSMWKVVDAVIYELKRLGAKVEKKPQSDELGVWWADEGGLTVVERP
ncbi:MAG: hydrogenase maturation protease [Candidatus Sulfotelmatobacter sp.]